YVNDRFGFSVEYPDNFIADSRPENNDGITVHDDDATLTVSGTHGWSSANGDYVTTSEVNSIEAIYEEEIADLEYAGFKIGYESVKDNWYVISYTNESHIVYYFQSKPNYTAPKTTPFILQQIYIHIVL